MSKYLKSIVLSFVMVVMFSGSASAQSPAPLSENEQRIQEHSQMMQKKAFVLETTSKELEELEQKKTELAKTLEAEKKLIEELKAKIAEKKRIEAIRAEEEARLAAFVQPSAPSYSPPTKRYAGNSAGNSYMAGQCTWHVKNLKPELPNMLGNADTWFYNARAQGWPTGYEARAGAAAQTKVGMHVTYVLEVYGNETMLISEMNYAGPYSQRTKVVNQNDYLYLY